MARLQDATGPSGRRGRRPAGVKPLRKRFLIVCEGQLTERLYFEAFPLPKDVHTVKGEGKNTTSLVRSAIEHADQGALSRYGPYDEVWVVYDRDDFSDQQFNGAELVIREASERRGEAWYAAWSNPAFELWYLLHFCYLDGQLHRDVVLEKVHQHLAASGGYTKGRRDMYQILRDKQQVALRHADKLAGQQQIQPDGSTLPAHACPCTTVFRLVEALNAEIPR